MSSPNPGMAVNLGTFRFLLLLFSSLHRGQGQCFFLLCETHADLLGLITRLEELKQLTHTTPPQWIQLIRQLCPLNLTRARIHRGAIGHTYLRSTHPKLSHSNRTMLPTSKARHNTKSNNVIIASLNLRIYPSHAILWTTSARSSRKLFMNS